jgi:putative ABC transport system permease protein
MPALGRLSAEPAGLRIDVDAPGGLPQGAWVYPADAPDPLPVAVAGQAPPGGVVRGLNGDPVRVATVATLPAVPRVGARARLVDLDYADRLAVGTARAVEPQVWLNASAPPDILGRLAGQGLTVVNDVRSTQTHRQLDEQGPALALWFYALAGGLSVLLGAGALVLAAAVDRGRRVEDLATLRAQGLHRSPMSRATLGTYPVLVVIATLVGALTALIGWGLTGWALPLAGLHPPDLPLPRWPEPPLVAGAVLAVLAVLALVAVLTGRDLRRRVDRRHRYPRG